LLGGLTLGEVTPTYCRAEGGESSHNSGSSWFGQLRALVSCYTPMDVLLELAMIRWYQAVEPNEEESELNMQKVRWETTDKGKTICKERYDLVDIRTIQKAVFLQPHPLEQETWFYNHFV
jgi:hypothetical protein